MSATLDTETFLNYFKYKSKEPLLKTVAGKTFPIKRSFLKTASNDYIQSIYSIISHSVIFQNHYKFHWLKVMKVMKLSIVWNNISYKSI